jgi:hypothetical protein
MSKFWKWLSGKLPKQLVFWAAVRVMGGNQREDGTIEVSSDEIAERLNHWREYAWTHPLRYHSQNLTNGKMPMWKHGRGWLYLWSKTIGLEWCFLQSSSNFSATITVGGEESHQLQFHLELPYLFSVFLSFQKFLHFRDWHYWGAFGRKTGIQYFANAFWFYLWHNDDETRFAMRPKIHGIHIHYEKHGCMISFHLADFFFGLAQYTTIDLSTSQGMVILPEGAYPVNVRIFESTWKRPRWPRPVKMIRADVEAVDQQHGIPSHAGKGENSWDLEDDALFSMTLPVSTPEEALKRVADSILRDRQKYGMPDLVTANKQ